MDRKTAARCIESCARYLEMRDESPRAAKDLREAVQVLMHEEAPTTETETRCRIGSLLATRCNNCYRKLQGYDVHGRGWNWITPNFGPFCDECFKDVRDGWHEMSTAPKDGTKINICAKMWLPAHDRFEYQRFTNCYWRDGSGYGVGVPTGWVGVDTPWHPVYWSLPLPLPKVE